MLNDSVHLDNIVFILPDASWLMETLGKSIFT